MWKECENQKKNQKSIQKKNKKKSKQKRGIKRKRMKEEKKRKAFTWLPMYFLGDVRVIWCNSLHYSHFQIYVINNVEIVFNFYLHVTFYVSHTLTNCTHHTQIFVKHYTCDCVLIIVAIQNCAFWNV